MAAAFILPRDRLRLLRLGLLLGRSPLSHSLGRGGLSLRGSEAAAEAGTASGFLSGRPRRFMGLCRASMARLSLSRSIISSATICSASIEKIETRRTVLSRLITYRRMRALALDHVTER